MVSRKNVSRPVYSTEHGRMCPGCVRPLSTCVCKSRTATSQGDGIVRLRRESKGRGGKTVTIIEGLSGDREALKAKTRQLKQHCGVGGALKEQCIEIQGDHRERIAALLRAEGLTVKLAGG